MVFAPRSLLASTLFILLLAQPYGFSFPAEHQASAAVQRLSVVSAAFEPGTSWPASSPVTVTVQFDQNVLLASWRWVGEDGQPVEWSGEALPANELRPLSGVWTGSAAAPPRPGSYRVRITARASGSTTTQDLSPNLRGTAVADDNRPARGMVFVRDGNIWLRSMDLRVERAVTFYGRPGSAAMPAWSPDGRRIAFVRDLGRVDSGYDLWTINPDGTGARVLSKHSGDRPLGYPQYAPDGTLYAGESRPVSFGGVELAETWDLQRVDQATGRRTPVLSGALMPDISPDGKQVVFVQQSITSDGGVESSLAVTDLSGANERVLVPAGAVNGLYAPAWSPDGRTILFASQGSLAAPVRPAGLAAPVAHGGPWDLWTIPASGGTPRLLSAVQEDLPYPRWHPDGSRVIFISPTGLWTVPAAGGPPQLVAPNSTHSELSIFAPQPRRAAVLAGASRCFEETGRCLRGVFLRYWESKGGLAQFGFPITDELVEEGRTVQYTQRARLEWHQEYGGTESEVLLGLLGADVADARASAGDAPFQRKDRASTAGSRYFPETGHNLAPPLRAYWESRGGLPVFGYPMSEAFEERSPTDGKVYLVQYFERNRLEHHPEYAGSDSEVLLGLLGVQEYERRYVR